MAKTQDLYPLEFPDNPGPAGAFTDPIQLGMFVPELVKGWTARRAPAPAPFTLDLSAGHAVFVGPPSSGLANIMRLIGGACVRRRDTLVMTIDEAGSLSAPWLTGETPLISRMATTANAAKSLLDHCSEIARHRMFSHQRVLARHNTDVLPVGDGRVICEQCDMPHPPAIVVLINPGMLDTHDPAAGQASLAMSYLLARGRAAAVRVVMASHHATADHLPSGQLRSFASSGVFTDDRDEQARVMGWTQTPGSNMPLRPGEGYFREHREPMRKFVSWRLSRAGAWAGAERVAAVTRPELDEAETSLGGRDYTSWMDDPEVRKITASL